MSEVTPYSERAWSYSGEDSIEGELGKAAFFVPASYKRQMREARINHTGGIETRLSAEQEHELAGLIQDGLAAQTEANAIEAQIAASTELMPDLEETYSAILVRVQQGKKAEVKLVETNLALSFYLARASMNILPKGHALLNDRLPWLPADFTSLRSSHAVLDDRIQVANMGLLRAARTFKPGTIAEQTGNLVSFAAFAAPVIKTDLTIYAKRGMAYTPRELPDILEKPIHLPIHVIDDIIQAHQDGQGSMTPERREELLGIERMQDIISLDDLYFVGAADEEVDDETQEPPMLWAGEVISEYEDGDPSHQIIGDQLSDRLNHALETLSMREAGVIRLRYGLVEDGRPRSLREVGKIYSLSPERIRQIESRAMDKLKHPSRSRPLREFWDLDDDGGEQPMRSGDIIKAPRSIGRSTLRLMVAPVDTRQNETRQGWQAYPDESWDEPVRKEPEQMEAEYVVTATKLKELLFGASVYPFQKSFADEVNSPYPKALADRIKEIFGHELKSSHIAEFWNSHLESFLDHLTAQLGDEVSPDRVIQLLSRLLSDRMKDNDTVTLHIPEKLQGKLNYVGAWLTCGTLQVIGDVGDYAGHEMGGLSRLQIVGAVRHFAGSGMKGYAHLEINGNTADFLGHGISGHSSILVNGDVGAYCGHRMKNDTTIEITGRAGASSGYDASGGEIVIGRKR